jgi:low affinity Fe/Cu permease
MTEQQYQRFIDKDYHDLLHELLEYRQTTVQDKELVQEIDRLWGFTPGAHHRAWEDEPAVTQHIAAVSHRSNNSRGRGLFRQCEDFVTSAFVDSQSISKSLQQELGSLYYQLEKEKVKFELLKTETAKSKRSLFLFQKDLIPGITGEILESKEQRDNVILEPVSARMKIIGWIFLGGLDLGMLFYVFLFAVSQDSHRQVAWGGSVGIYLLLDIVLISTVMVIFMHVLLPSLIMRDVGKIKKKMIESIEQFYETLEKNKIALNGKPERKSTEDDETEVSHEKDQLHRKKEKKLDITDKKKIIKSRQEDQKMTALPAFNAAKYLFLSYRMASIYPDLKTSQIILSYSSPWPKQDYQHITNVKSDYSGGYSAITRSISIIVVFFLTNLLATPIAIQDMILQIATTAMMGYTLFVMQFDIITVRLGRKSRRRLTLFIFHSLLLPILN